MKYVLLSLLLFTACSRAYADPLNNGALGVAAIAQAVLTGLGILIFGLYTWWLVLFVRRIGEQIKHRQELMGFSMRISLRPSTLCTIVC
jgi:hypothetical protein